MSTKKKDRTPLNSPTENISPWIARPESMDAVTSTVSYSSISQCLKCNLTTLIAHLKEQDDGWLLYLKARSLENEKLLGVWLSMVWTTKSPHMVTISQCDRKSCGTKTTFTSYQKQILQQKNTCWSNQTSLGPPKNGARHISAQQEAICQIFHIT